MSDESPVGAWLAREERTAVFRYYASSFFAGKPRSHRVCVLTDRHSLLRAGQGAIRRLECPAVKGGQSGHGDSYRVFKRLLY